MRANAVRPYGNESYPDLYQRTTDEIVGAPPRGRPEEKGGQAQGPAPTRIETIGKFAGA